MKKLFLIFVTLFLVFEVAAEGQESAPLRLVRTITLPPDVKGHFDHFEVDLKGGRHSGLSGPSHCLPTLKDISIILRLI